MYFFLFIQRPWRFRRTVNNNVRYYYYVSLGIFRKSIVSRGPYEETDGGVLRAMDRTRTHNNVFNESRLFSEGFFFVRPSLAYNWNDVQRKQSSPHCVDEKAFALCAPSYYHCRHHPGVKTHKNPHHTVPLFRRAIRTAEDNVGIRQETVKVRRFYRLDDTCAGPRGSSTHAFGP